MWGDASLWWKIADANGLSQNAALNAGQQLVIPAGVMRNTYNANTFTPYDPQAAMGNNAPGPVLPKPKKQNGWDMFAKILMVVVAVVVAAVVAPYLAGAISQLAGGTVALGTTATVGGVTTTTFGAGALTAGEAGAMALTAAFSGGAVTLGGVGASAFAIGGAIAGAAASIASQVVGVASGVQEKFSWNAVAMGAIGGALGSGSLGIASPILRAMTSNALGQGAAMALHWQSKFSWSGMAAAGIGSWIGGHMPGGIVEHSTASAIANAATRSLIDHTDFGDNLLAAIPDAIGQTIGQMFAGSIAKSVERASLSSKAGEIDSEEAARAVPASSRSQRDPRLIDAQLKLGPFDGFALRYGQTTNRQAVADSAALQIELLTSALPTATGAQKPILEQQLLEAMGRMELAAPGALRNSGLTFEAGQVEAVEQYAIAANQMARALRNDPDFVPIRRDIVAMMDGPQAANWGTYLDRTFAMFAATEMTVSAGGEEARLKAIGILAARRNAVKLTISDALWGDTPNNLTTHTPIYQIDERLSVAAIELMTPDERRAADFGARQISGAEELYRLIPLLNDTAVGAVQYIGMARSAAKTSGIIDQKAFADASKPLYGPRPAPESYLSQEYIDAHASLFRNGAARVQSSTRGFGARRDTWVIPADLARSAIKQAGGNVAALERSLGLNPGDLGTNPMLVEIPKPLNLRMPSGNEVGANSFWRPGGYTSGGVPEAVINAPVPGSYTMKPVW
jgi:hypothetical protein